MHKLSSICVLIHLWICFYLQVLMSAWDTQNYVCTRCSGFHEAIKAPIVNTSMWSVICRMGCIVILCSDYFTAIVTDGCSCHSSACTWAGWWELLLRVCRILSPSLPPATPPEKGIALSTTLSYPGSHDRCGYFDYSFFYLDFRESRLPNRKVKADPERRNRDIYLCVIFCCVSMW